MTSRLYLRILVHFFVIFHFPCVKSSPEESVTIAVLEDIRACLPFINVYVLLPSGQRIELQLLQSPALSQSPPILVGPNFTSVNLNGEGNVVCFYQDDNKHASMSLSLIDEQLLWRGTFSGWNAVYRLYPRQSLHGMSFLRLKGVVEHVVRVLPMTAPMPSPNRSRKRRAESRRLAIELLVLPDWSIYQFYYDLHNDSYTEDIRKLSTLADIAYYYCHLVNEVDMRYRSIKSDSVSLEVSLAGFYIPQSREESWSEKFSVLSENATERVSVDSEKFLDAVEKWTNQNTKMLPNFDHAASFTRYDLYSMGKDSLPDKSRIGSAVVGGICQYHRVSVNEDLGQFNSDTTMAHELGHNLGAGHDGTENSCDASMQYIMAAVVENASKELYKNMYTFSACTVSELVQHISKLDRLNKNCLMNSPFIYDKSDWLKNLGVLPGQKYNIEQQCINVYGAGSYYCGSEKNKKKICRNLFCYHPQRSDCFILGNVAAAQGTTCGNKQWCIQGECVNDAKAPAANDDCLFGDYPGSFPIGNMTTTCHEMTRTQPWLCYHKVNRQLCCKSCSQIKKKNLSNCEFGDRAEWCAKMDARDCYHNALACCEMCTVHENANSPDCKYGDKENWCKGMTSDRCYLNDKPCCQTCRSFRTVHSDCQYGDQASWCSSLTKFQCYANAKVCCQYCRALETGIPAEFNCTYGDHLLGCLKTGCKHASYGTGCCETCFEGGRIKPPTSPNPPETSEKPSASDIGRADPGISDQVNEIEKGSLPPSNKKNFADGEYSKNAGSAAVPLSMIMFVLYLFL